MLPPTPLPPTSEKLSVWPLSLGGPAESLASSVAIGIVRTPESSATLLSESSTASGGWLTIVLVIVVPAVELLLAVFGSKSSDVIEAVLFITVPLGLLEVTAAVRVNCALVPVDSTGKTQDTVPFVPAAGAVHVAAGPVSCVSEMKVVPLGRGSLKTTFCPLSGPALAAVMVQVMLLLPPLLTVAAAGPVLTTLRSTDDTRTDAVPTLFSAFGSEVSELTVALLTYVVTDVPGGICPVSVNEALCPALSAKIEQVTVPFAPTAGVVQGANVGPEF